MRDKPHSDSTEVARPFAGSLIESLRGLGYSLETAIADLLDNSITAKARNIWLTFWWDGSSSSVLIEDDGHGMDDGTLSRAMRLGTHGPEEVRASNDLGRFGLGLKTASMSQCRRLTVRSWVDKRRSSTRCWDIDIIKESNEWLLLKQASATADALIVTHRQGTASGTMVVWEGLDRLVGEQEVEDKAAHNRFLEHVARVRAHLGVVFHRFLEGKHGITILVNGQPVVPWDPFLAEHPATQKLGHEVLSYKGAQVTVYPFVLPHHSKLSKDEHTLAASERGWNAAQGFYVYRARRLLVAGDWLGIGFQKEEHSKLARIQVDLPNSIDQDWQLDVRKAKARPPGVLRVDLRRIAKVCREKAVSVYRHRGKIIDRTLSASSYVWHQQAKSGKVFFSINRAHPLVAELLAEPQPVKARIQMVLRLIEETVPIPAIAILTSQHPEGTPIPFDLAPEGEVETLARRIFNALTSSGMTGAQAAERLRTLEPFPMYDTLLDRLLPELIANA